MIVPNTQKIENDKRAILQVKVYISILNFCNFIVIEKFFKFQKYTDQKIEKRRFVPEGPIVGGQTGFRSLAFNASRSTT